MRLLRLIYLSPTLSALVLLLVRMTTDLLKLLVLLIFVVVALVSAMYVVEPTWTGDDELDRLPRIPACDDFYILGGSWNNWAKLFFLVLNAVVDGRAQDALFMYVPMLLTHQLASPQSPQSPAWPTPSLESTAAVWLCVCIQVRPARRE